MKKRLLRLTAFALFALAAATSAFAQNVETVKIDFDRETQIYSVGESAKISISALDKDGANVGAGTLSVRLTNDGRDQLGDVLTFDLSKENPISIDGKLDFPGFLQVSATATSADENAPKKSALGGAAFDPFKIEPGLPVPDDFDEFWAAGQAEVRAIPINVKQTKIDSLSDETRDVYSVSFATVNGQRVYGYLGVPKTGEKPFPTLVNVPGAGPGIGPELGCVAEGFVVLNMNVFPYEVPLDKAERQRLYDEYNKEHGIYCRENGGDREKYFFRAAYLGIDRAVDWLAEQDFVDAKRIGYHGSSQGGASGLILGGLNKNFCAILTAVPALCDHAGGLKGRSPGWPRLVPSSKDDPNVLEASRYLDGVNFARRIDVPIETTVGFIDVVCSPSSVCAAFNVIPSASKNLICEPKRGHSNGAKYMRALARLKARVKNAAVETVKIDFDRESQMYSVGESAKISIAALDKDGANVGAGTISVRLTNDGRDQIGDVLTFDLSKENPITVDGKLDFPGFLQVSATATSADENAPKKSALGGAAFDPFKIEPGLPIPDDFDEFWAAGQAEVRAIPIDTKQTKIDSLSDENRDVYAVNFATVDGGRVYGYLSVPKKGDGPFPTLVNVPGAGPGVGPDAWLAAEGFVVLNMNVFPYEVPLDVAERKRLYDEYNEKRGLYCWENGGDREKYFFRAAYLGIDRAVDWLAEQNFVDKNRIGYFGTSQGGASALILGGLNKNFCAILASVPALCDHAGGLKGRSPGWPRLVDTLKDNPNVLEASRYLDGVNFARRIETASIETTVGFIDTTCSPSSVCAAFNVIPSADKTLLCEPKRGHDNGEQYARAFERLKAKVKSAPVASVRIDFDRESQIYAVGESAKLTIAALDKDGANVGAGTISVRLTNDGRDQIGDVLTFDLSKANPITVDGKLDKPGFLQISVAANSVAKNAPQITALGGAAFDPYKIEPGLPKPDDFDEFWAAGQAEVRQIPIDVQQTKINSLSDENRDVYEISFATVGGRRVYGFLGVPTKGEQPFPTLVQVAWAGPGIAPHLGPVAEGFVTFDMNVFPYPVPLDEAERKRLYDEYNATVKDGGFYWFENAGNRDEYFFRAAYLGIDRAVDWLAEQDFVDAKRIGFYGTSQGGGSALILGGLNKNFCAILSSVPAICDHAGGLTGRTPGWPRLVDTLKDNPNVLEASRYLDGVNFARRIDVPIETTVGFIDVTCSPSSVCAAFNVIPSTSKTLLCEPKLGHWNGSQYAQAFARLKEKVKNAGR